MLNGKKIVIGVTGSIAAYKTATLVRLLVKDGAEVKIVMTKSAADFITPLTLGTLSKNEVSIDLFSESTWANHVMLGRWADLMVIAPLSCNTLAKMATGACDNLLLAVYLSATCPVYVAPAMDEDMWKHPAVKANLSKLDSFGNKIIPVANGELASGLSGEGRMAEPEQILEIIRGALSSKKPLAGKKALVTAGPTYEAIDPVRFVGNHSSGKMGIEIAKSLHEKGADVQLVLGPVNGDFQLNGIKVTRVESAQEMFDACASAFPKMDIAVMAAAVADYTPVEKADVKIKKSESAWSLNFRKTPDILKNLGGLKTENQVLVGFALETNNEEVNAKNKLQDKNADLIILNSLNDAGAGFGYDTNKVTIFDRKGNEFKFEMKTKKAVAEDIVQAIINTVHA